MFRWLSLLLLLALASQSSWSAERASAPTPAERGYKLLVEKAYLPPDFDQETFDASWKHWPEPLRSQAEKLSLEERRRLAFARYGLTPRPDDPTKPLQYVVDERGNWTMNCFACHGPDKNTRMVDLRLDTQEGVFSPRDNGTPIVPGNPKASLVYQRITEEDSARRMPPESSHKSLTAEQKEILRRWIEQGASWKQHWSFVPPARPALPAGLGTFSRLETLVS